MRTGRLAVACAALAAVVVAGLAHAGDGPKQTPPPVFETAPCPEDLFPPDADVDCGFIRVPESRDRRKSRTIKVAAAVMHAPNPSPKPDPIVFLDGGPSFGAISAFAVDAYFGGTSYSEDRDVILVDTRGTGISQPRLGCPELDRADEKAFYARPTIFAKAAEIFGDAVEACHDRLERSGIDLEAYNSAESAADLDALRRALGYDRWNLIALSADGVLGLTYMRLFPDAIRSVILDSAESNTLDYGLDFYRGFSELLEKAFAGCAANGACNAAYPNLRKVFFDFVHKLEKHPVNVTLPDFQPKPVVLRVTGVDFYLDALFSTSPDAILPMFDEVWRATHGELVEVYRERLGTGPEVADSDSFVARGKTMSYVCHDIVGFLSEGDIRRAARELPELAPLFLDDDFELNTGGTESPAACDIWDVGVAERAQHQPVRSSIPTLVLAGEYDTGIVPFVVRQIPPTLSHSYFYEFPAAPHIQLASFNPVSDCSRAIAAEFLDTPAATPDSSCIASLPQFDFTP